MNISVTYHERLDTDCLEIRIQVSGQSVKEARSHVPQIQSHETPTMYLVRLADWIGTLPPYAQILEEEGPPPTHEELGTGRVTLDMPKRDPEDV